jgi:hypothetical protein
MISQRQLTNGKPTLAGQYWQAGSMSSFYEANLGASTRRWFLESLIGAVEAKSSVGSPKTTARLRKQRYGG